ncbi:hypothetical protein LguiA_007596 [Lonicera macranthoides]
MNSESERSLQDLVNCDIGSSSNSKHKQMVPFQGEYKKDAFLCIKQRAGGQSIRALSSSHSTPSSADELTEFHDKKFCAETSALEVCSEVCSEVSRDMGNVGVSLNSKGATLGDSFPDRSYTKKKTNNIPPKTKLPFLSLSYGCEARQPIPDEANPRQI